MGLFDGLFDAQGYSGQGGGLLDMLRNIQVQQQYQPGAGFSPPAATFAERFDALPQAQATPRDSFAQRFEPAYDQPSGYMKVGDYNMPQFGPRELYQPQQAQIPPNAQPTQGQMPPQAPATPQPPNQSAGTPPAFLQPQSPSGFGGAMRGLVANAHTGPIGALMGAVGGAMGMGQGNPQDVARQNLKAQYDALVPIIGPQKAMLAVMNPEYAKAFMGQIAPTYKPHNIGETAGAFNEADGSYKPLYTSPKTEKVGSGETLVQLSGGTPNAPRTATPVSGVPSAQPKFEDVASIRKEVGGLPETKRYAEAAPIYRSMIQSRDVNTAAADLDFVYGVAKIFDPESVVREGEMKLVGKAQSLPEDIKGMMGQVAMAKGRLTPEARQRILEVAQTRMSELRGAYDTRVKPYGEIAGRFNMRPEDVLPSVPDMPKLAPLSSAQVQEGATATNPQTGQKLTFRNGKWQ